MKHLLETTIGVILLTGFALGQSTSAPAAFEVADVRAKPSATKEGGLYFHAGRFEMHGITMLHLITSAYSVREDKVFGGPNWLDSDRFDIIAKTEASVQGEALKSMLQALLAERFKLAIHKEDKPEPILALVPGKRLLLKEKTEPGEIDCKRFNQDGYITATCQNVTMARLAELLPGWAPNYFSLPVVDKTGLKGAYDLTLKWTGRGQIGAGDADHPSISLLDYIDKQLGIKVEPQTRPSPSIVIDRVDQTPTPNLPGISAKLPPATAEFEVAEVRPSKPDAKQSFDMKNGRLTLLGITLKTLVTWAYDVDDNMVTGGEKWLDSDRFDVIAKATPATADETLRVMLRTLLKERFHLVAHNEQVPATVFALTVLKGKPKLKEADGQGTTGCTRTPGDGAFTYSCRNTTMAQLVQRLPDVNGAGNYLDHPLIDLTGLKGGYDFDFTWSPPARFDGRVNGGGSPSAGGAGTAVAPPGGVTLFEAFEKQLGLKLALEKHPMPGVVIDRVDRTPTEN